jgi:hypothetical protein
MSSNARIFADIIEEPIALVVIIPVALLLFLLKQILFSVPDAINDFKKSDDEDEA